MKKCGLQPAAPIRAFALAFLLTLSVAGDLPAFCSSSRSPERDLWIEVVSCSDQVLQEVTDELFVQALARTGGDWTRFAAPRATELLRATPGVLIVAREVAFADSTRPFTKRTPTGKSESAYSDRPGEWQSAGTQPERRFFLGSAEATCEGLMAGGSSCARSLAAATPAAGPRSAASSRRARSCRARRCRRRKPNFPQRAARQHLLRLHPHRSSARRCPPPSRAGARRGRRSSLRARRNSNRPVVFRRAIPISRAGRPHRRGS
jgi:hypothetical protein